LILCWLPLPLEADERQAAELLRSRGLTPVGNQWRSAADIDLRQRVSALDTVMQRSRDARTRVEELVKQNEYLRSNIQQLETALKLARGQRSSPPESVTKQIKSLENRLAEARKRYLPPAQFCEHPSSKSAVVALNAAHTRLYLDSVTIPLAAERINDRYAALRSELDVQRALTAVGNGHRIAQIALSARDRQRLLRAQKTSIRETIPLFRDAGQWRVSAIVGQQTPTTLSYVPGQGPGLLPDSVRRKAGILIPKSAQAKEFRTPDGRRLKARMITVDYLRLGPHVLEDVVFLALPPEGEDLGGRITDQSLGRFQAQADPARLRLSLRQEN
jgi:hypothetical protein